jgi:hypothetical protein
MLPPPALPVLGTLIEDPGFNVFAVEFKYFPMELRGWLAPRAAELPVPRLPLFNVPDPTFSTAARVGTGAPAGFAAPADAPIGFIVTAACAEKDHAPLPAAIIIAAKMLNHFFNSSLFLFPHKIRNNT